MTAQVPSPPARTPFLNGGKDNLSNTWLDWLTKIRNAIAPTRYFSVYKTSNQAITNNVWTKVLWDAGEPNTIGNDFPNNSFHPSVPGYYHLSAFVSVPIHSTTQSTCVALYKNGNAYIWSGAAVSTTATYQTPFLSTVMYLNGSTDYVEVFVYGDWTAPQSLVGDFPGRCRFQGILLQQ
jgi:hypothetical protein